MNLLVIIILEEDKKNGVIKNFKISFPPSD